MSQPSFSLYVSRRVFLNSSCACCVLRPLHHFCSSSLCSHTRKQTAQQSFALRCKIWLRGWGQDDWERKCSSNKPLLMSWREIYIAWWLRILGNYPRAPQGLICDEYRSGDNGSQSIPVSGGQRERQLPWFNMSYLLTQEITDGFVNHFFISSQRTGSINAGVPLLFLLSTILKGRFRNTWSNPAFSKWDNCPPLKTGLLSFMVAVKTVISKHNASS